MTEIVDSGSTDWDLQSVLNCWMSEDQTLGTPLVTQVVDTGTTDWVIQKYF